LGVKWGNICFIFIPCPHFAFVDKHCQTSEHCPQGIKKTLNNNEITILPLRRLKMKLTEQQIRNAKPTDKPQKLFDGGGLYLEILTTGTKSWRMKYRYLRKESRLTIGQYPEVSLFDAREERDKARESLKFGKDPKVTRKIAKLTGEEDGKHTFENVAMEWFERNKVQWTEDYTNKTLSLLRRKLFCHIGLYPIKDITAPVLLDALHKIQDEQKYDTVMRAKQLAGRIFKYAITLGYADNNPVPNLDEVLISHKVVHRAAITDPREVGRLLVAIDAYEGSPEVRYALKLAPLTFVRPGELRHAEWSEIQWGKQEWLIPAEKMKMREDHVVPLSTQAVEVLQEIRNLTRISRYVFPGARSLDRPMSENAVLAALRIMGYPKEKMTGHGFRAMARTLLDDELGYRVDWIEQQLAHAVRDVHGRAYNRTKHLTARKEMMQGWANYLDQLRENAESNEHE
jgi:integrase